MTIMPSPPLRSQTRDAATFALEIENRFGAGVSVLREESSADLSFLVWPAALPSLCRFLFWESGGYFGGLIVEEREEWNLSYLFSVAGAGWVQAIVRLPLGTTTVPSIVAEIHAADWYEREAEDLFGLHFEGHPRLGDFVLHNEIWQEEIAPMRREFDAAQPHFERLPDENWRPTLVVQDPGSFAMPVGPVYEGGLGESVHFLLETVGEDVIRAAPRLFYKYRAIEKIAERKAIGDVLLLSERFSATSSFAHSLAFCQALEYGSHTEIPPRACRLRVALCELERLRHHAGAIQGICHSTAFSVSESHAAIIEEQLLRASCIFAGHRYLFGLNCPGGLRRDFDSQASREVLHTVDCTSAQLEILQDRLRYSSSFLDRLEDAGNVSPESARDLDLVGPVGRASGLLNDLRRLHPYSGYELYEFNIPSEQEGDGYARLRVLFAEAQQSARVIRQAIESLEPGEIAAHFEPSISTASFGWVEAPIGAALHWVRLDDKGQVMRYRILTPSFRNWLGFHVAVEDFAFQDFPIILSTFALSAAECDR